MVTAFINNSIADLIDVLSHFNSARRAPLNMNSIQSSFYYLHKAPSYPHVMGVGVESFLLRRICTQYQYNASRLISMRGQRNVIPTTHAPETGATNRLHFLVPVFVAGFSYHIRLVL